MSFQFTRRDFIKLIGAGGAAGLAGCATEPAAPAKPVGTVIVIGGGYGGATAAKYIRMWSGGKIQVFLIERNTSFVSCPLSNLVLGGSMNLEALTMGYQNLRNYGVQVIRDEVTAINIDKKRVVLKRVEDLPYDRLVVAPGIDFLFNEVAGLDAKAQETILHAWKAGPQTVALRKQLEAMPDGGTYILSIPKAPYRCPPGPYERACQVASYFKQAKPRSKVLVLDGNEDIVSKKGLFMAAWDQLYKGIIEYRPNQDVKQVDAAALTVRTEFDNFKGNVINVIPPQRAGDIAQQAKLITANNRWCGVDWQTTQSVAVPGIYVIGDATLAAPAMPKSGSMANNQAKIAASAICAEMLGQPLNPQPQIVNTCYSYVSATEAVHVASVHRWDADKKSLLTVPGSGGVSAQRTEIEKQYADAWAKNIWADTLG
ncbi:MAG: NAD(P)/FAD-dependent oxidoreductase [Burkholderiales bacterium]|jgi:NADH dehydrogenase FAD-containing subunit|nr:NAD(P)/FAD-dependent oxidoreductase [Burkholderiales bacterium]